MIGFYHEPDGYVCNRCGHEMNSEDVCLSYDDTIECSSCGSCDVDDAYRCDICGKLAPDHQGSGYGHFVCDDCLDKKRYDLDFCTKVGEDEGTEVVLNSFLAEFFTESEINELMLTALKERAKMKPIDGLKYLRYASGVAADLLCEQESD